MMQSNIAQLKESGFDFVHDSQQVFRLLMMSLAYPGRIHYLKNLPLSLAEEKLGFAAQSLLTLLDPETSFYVHGKDRRTCEEIARYLSLNTGCSEVILEAADYILCLDGSLEGGFLELKRGSLFSPDRSATVFYHVAEIGNADMGAMTHLILSGPGIRDRSSIFVSGLQQMELEHWEAYREEYPMGVDIYLVSEAGCLAGIPRSVSIQI